MINLRPLMCPARQSPLLQIDLFSRLSLIWAPAL